MKRQTTNLEKMFKTFINSIFHTWLVSRLYKEPSRTEKTNSSIFKIDERVEQKLHQKEYRKKINIKACPTSLAIQIKTKMRYYYSPIKIAHVRNINNTKCRGGHRTNGTLTHCWQKCKTEHHSENCLAVSYKVEYAFTICSTIPLLTIYPRKRTFIFTQKPTY